MATEPTWYDKMLGRKPAPAADTEHDDVDLPAPHPVLAAAVAAGVDTPEKFAQMQAQAESAQALRGQLSSLTTERDGLKAKAAAYDAATPTKRAQAKASAAIAYAADEQARQHALEDIDAIADGPALDRIAARLDAAAKAAVPDADGQRQTAAVEAPAVVRAPAQDAAGKMTAAQEEAQKTKLLAQAGIHNAAPSK